MRNEVLVDPHPYGSLKGRYSRYRRHKRGDLRLVVARA